MMGPRYHERTAGLAVIRRRPRKGGGRDRPRCEYCVQSVSRKHACRKLSELARLRPGVEPYIDSIAGNGLLPHLADGIGNAGNVVGGKVVVDAGAPTVSSNMNYRAHAQTPHSVWIMVRMGYTRIARPATCQNRHSLFGQMLPTMCKQKNRPVWSGFDLYISSASAIAAVVIAVVPQQLPTIAAPA